MKASVLTGSLVQLTRLGAVNAFLVRENDGFTLIDTMFTGSAKAILAAADEAGAPIKRIVVTHAHSDHVGSLKALEALLPEAELIASERESRLMRGDRDLDPGESDRKLRGGYPKLEIEFDREVREDDSIGSLRVTATPGHTPGQIGLMDTRDGSLIAADAYSSLGGVATTASPYWRFPLPGLATWDRAKALESASKLRGHEPRLLAVGHGPALKDPVGAMEAAIRRHG